MKTLRFLFMTSDTFPPNRVDVSVLFGDELISRGHHIDWLMQSDSSCTKTGGLTFLGGYASIAKTDPRKGLKGVVKRKILDFVNDMKVFQLLRNNPYDFVQLKDKFFVSLFVLIAAKLYKKKFIYWLSFPFPEAAIYRAKMGFSSHKVVGYCNGVIQGLLLYHVILPMADHVFVQSEQMKEDIVGSGLGREKLTAVPMGVSWKQLTAFEQKHMGSHENIQNNVVYLGALNKARGMGFLLRAFVCVVDVIEDAILYFVGSGKDADDIPLLSAEADKLGLKKHVVFTGNVPRETGWRYVRNAAVCVSPLDTTPIFRPASPTKLVEYMALGKPVVVNEHPEQRRIVNESGGGYCVPYDEQLFAKAIIELLRNKKLAKEMGGKGRAYIKKYRSYSVLADLVEKKYLSICCDVN